MKKYTPQALAAAEKWARLTTGFLAALFLFYAYWMLADLELVPTPAFLPDFLFSRAVWNTLRTVILACAAEAGFWYNLAQETGREVPASTIRIALLILLAGALVFCPVRGRRFSFMEEGRRSRFWVLFAVGSGVGFVAGLTGAGGPVLSVPIMIALGFPPLIAIGAGQVYSVPVALSGSAANFLHGAIDYKVGALMIVIQILGILLGVYMANRMDTTKLRKMVAWVCLFCGGFILVNAIRGILAM